jgi:hypothetical protein
MWITLVALYIGMFGDGATATCSKMHGLHVHLVCCVRACALGGWWSVWADGSWSDGAQLQSCLISQCATSCRVCLAMQDLINPSSKRVVLL